MVELADFNMDIVPRDASLIEAPDVGHVPMAVETETKDMDAIFSVWFARSRFSPEKMLTMHVYDPAIEQTISRTLSAFDTAGNLAFSDIAFHMRIIMGASLYSDLDEIVEEEDLMALAVPEERKSLIVPEPRKRRTWVRLDLGYLFSGYPEETHWYHGIALDAAVVPIERLEVFLDLSALFLQDPVRIQEPDPVSFTNRQFLLGFGARYDVLAHERIAILPHAGFHLGISTTRVTRDRVERFTKLHPAFWAGLDVRFSITEHVGIGVGLSFENLFRYEQFFLSNPETPDFRLAQLRFASHVVLCVSI